MMKRVIVLTFTLLGLLSVLVPVPAVQAKPQSAEDEVLAYIESHMPWPQGTARIEFLSQSSEPATLKKYTHLKIEQAGNSDLIGDVAFLVRYMEGSRLVRTETVRTRIEVQRDHVIALRNLQPGTILTEGDLRIVQKWVRRIHPEAIFSTGEAIGKQLSTQVRTGTEMVSHMLKDAPLVRKGKIVKVVFDNGPMRVVTSGLPEEDGIAGAIIRVKNLTSNKIIYTRVLGHSLVGIEI